MSRLRSIATPALGLPLLGIAMAGAAAEPVTAGWLERVKLGTEAIVVSGKLDTGADHSSLHAVDIKWFARDDGDWVAFDVIGDDGRKTRFERKVLRIARVRQASGVVQKRPTILLGLCVGPVYRVTQVNLTDRRGLKQELLVGRSFLAGHFTVDSARQYTVEPDCRETRGG